MDCDLFAASFKQDETRQRASAASAPWFGQLRKYVEPPQAFGKAVTGLKNFFGPCYGRGGEILPVSVRRRHRGETKTPTSLLTHPHTRLLIILPFSSISIDIYPLASLCLITHI